METKDEKWIKELISAHEFLNGKKRYCLWLENITKEELEEMPLVKERVNNVFEVRLKSSRPQLAEVPHLFAQITQPQNKEFILITRYSSDDSDYNLIVYFNDTLYACVSSHLIATSYS